MQSVASRPVPVLALTLFILWVPHRAALVAGSWLLRTGRVVGRVECDVGLLSLRLALPHLPLHVRIRAVNSFLTWLREEDHTSERLRNKVLRVERKSLTTFGDLDLRKLITFHPTDHTERRAWTMAPLMLDCGLRIDEVMRLERSNVDLDSLVLKVVGKGSKERQVPISPECRKHFWRYLTRESIAGRYVFAVRTDERLTYRNAYRDIARVCAAAGIKGKSNAPNFRNCFSMNYVRNGGDLYRLSRIHGHASISTTQLYLRSMGVEHLREGHAKFSPLGNLAVQR